MKMVNRYNGRIGYMAFVYGGFYCNIYVIGGFWEFEVYSGGFEEDIILWGNNTPVMDISIGSLIELIMKKLDTLSSVNYA